MHFIQVNCSLVEDDSKNVIYVQHAFNIPAVLSVFAAVIAKEGIFIIMFWLLDVLQTKAYLQVSM